MKLFNSIVFIYLLITALLYIFQRDFIYFPTSKKDHNYQIENFMINDEKIEVVVLNKKKENAILYFGGNAESVVNNASIFLEIFKNHTVYLINYRGFAGSSGNPTEEGLYKDSLSIYDKIIKRHKNISVMGRSLGTGIATYLASNRDTSKLILITPYDSIEHIAQDKYIFFPISILLKDKYNSVERVNKIKSKTLIILAQYDNIINSKYSQILIDAFPKEQIIVKTIKEMGHITLSDSKEYNLLLQNFMQ